MANGPISWKSVKQGTVARSSTAAEAASASECLDETMWTREMLKFLGFPQNEPTRLFMDNQAAIKCIKNGNTTKRSKYFRVRIDDLHDCHEKELIAVHHVRTHELPADALTKSLSWPILLKHMKTLNIVDIFKRADEPIIGLSGGVGKTPPLAGSG